MIFVRCSFLLEFDFWIYFNGVYIIPVVTIPFNSFLVDVNLDVLNIL